MEKKKLETKISLVVGDHVQQLNIFFFNVLIWFWYFLAIGGDDVQQLNILIF